MRLYLSRTPAPSWCRGYEILNATLPNAFRAEGTSSNPNIRLPWISFAPAMWPGNPVSGAGRYRGDTVPALPVRFVASPILTSRRASIGVRVVPVVRPGRIRPVGRRAGGKDGGGDARG